MITSTPQWAQDLSRNHLLKLFEYDMIHLMKKRTKPKKEDYPEHKKHKALKDIPIHIKKASRKYNISDATLSRYAEIGLIEVIGKDKNRILLDEQDVAYCADILNKYGGKGKKAFNDDGTPNY